jgi:multidrug efflux pump subunit AcrB
MYRALASGIVLVFTSALNCAAQSSDPGSQPSSQAPAPATAQAASPDADATAPDQAKKKPKKVWTNEEIPAAGGEISVVGDSSPSHPNNGTTNSAKRTNAQRVETFRKLILQYRKQMDALDKQIAEFRNFRADDSSGGMDPHGRYTMTPSEDRIQQLEDKKKQIQAKIDAIEEAARKEGIEPGQLR